MGDEGHDGRGRFQPHGTDHRREHRAEYGEVVLRAIAHEQIVPQGCRMQARQRQYRVEHRIMLQPAIRMDKHPEGHDQAGKPYQTQTAGGGECGGVGTNIGKQRFVLQDDYR
jgi:hypothetical protein